MDNDIITGFNSLAAMIAERVIEDLKKEFSDLIPALKPNSDQSLERKYIRGNKALAEFLGVTPEQICVWKSKRILEDAIVSEYGRVIIYDKERVLKCLNHRKTKPGRRKEEA